MTSMSIPYEPIKKKLHNYYCQIMAYEVCDARASKILGRFTLMNGSHSKLHFDYIQS
jgi:hypothetical protein